MNHGYKKVTDASGKARAQRMWESEYYSPFGIKQRTEDPLHILTGSLLHILPQLHAAFSNCGKIKRRRVA